VAIAAAGKAVKKGLDRTGRPKPPAKPPAVFGLGGSAGVGAKLRIVTTKLDVGSRGHEVRRVQQLLARVTMLADDQVTGTWDKATTEAVLAFQEFMGVPTGKRTAYLLPDLDPADEYHVLFELALDAQVLMPLPYPDLGAKALVEFFRTAQEHKVSYVWKEGVKRLAFGLAGRGYLVFTNLSKEFDNAPAYALNCIAFANLAISVWRTGLAHDHPYDAVQTGSGGFEALGTRYNLPFVRSGHLKSVSDEERFKKIMQRLEGSASPPGMFGFSPGIPSGDPLGTIVDLNRQLLLREPRFLQPTVRVSLPANPPADPESTYDYGTYFYRPREVLDMVSPTDLYYLQWCRVNNKHKSQPSGFGHHDTVLYNGNVYECNIPTPAMRMTPLMKRFVEGDECVRLMGPV
jgi:hypothetical protein